MTSGMTTKDWHKKAQELHQEGYSYRAIGRELKKDESIIRRYLNKVRGEVEIFGKQLNKPTETFIGEWSEEDVFIGLRFGGKTETLMNSLKSHLETIPLMGGASKGSFIFDPQPIPDNVSAKDFQKKPLSIIMIADTQCKPNTSLEYCRWIGEYIYEKQPDVVVHIGDHADCPSLSSYDKGKKSFEGRRLKEDLEAAKLGMDLLVGAFKKDGYNPRMVFCTGNHEERLDRLANDMPELSGFVGTQLLNLEQYGWEVYPFLKPAVVGGIYFVHYLANPMTGKPYSGTAMSQLKTVGNSFCVGHKQVLDVAIRPTLDGKHQIGIINGACYDHHEDYKGYTGNNHFRGLTVLHEVEEGFGLPMFVSLDYLKRKYGN